MIYQKKQHSFNKDCQQDLVEAYMKYTLRPYQEKVVNKMMWATTIEGNSVVCLPTGSGKSLVIAAFAERYIKQHHKPVLVLSPNKEILEQNYQKVTSWINDSKVSYYSASMDEKEINQVTLATIGSIYKIPEKFTHFGVCVLDEGHLCNPKKMNTMYRKFFKEAGIKNVISTTATPFRQDVYYDFPGGWKNYKGTRYQKTQIEAVTTTKMLVRYKEMFWDRMLCVINTQQLIDKDYLCELDYDLIDLVKHTDIPLNVSKSDFDIDAFEQLLSDKEQLLITKINEISNNHKNLLVFCSSIKQAKLLSGVKNGSDYVDSTMTKKQRSKAISDFRTGKTKVMFNVGILTTGFDMPELEAIALIRPTRSLNLYNQMLGRLTRKADNKEVGMVYDFSGTVRTLGRLETIEVKKIDGKWDVSSETFEDGFHHKKLYSWRVNR